VGEIIHKLSTVALFSPWCQAANPAEKSACWNDKKITAHHGIIPLPVTPDLDAMSEKERNVYQVIVQRYLAQFFPPAEDDATTVELAVGVHRFKASGKVERVKGWRVVTGKEVSDNENSDDSDNLPLLSIGQTLAGQYQREDKKTKPPSRFTEGTLIDAMSNIAKFESDPKLKSILKETSGIGTEATRAAIIYTLKSRGFVTIKGKQLISEEKGRSLIDALPDVLSRPAMTALWEQALDDIAVNNGSLSDFMVKQQGFVTQIVNMFKQGQYTLKLPKIEQITLPCPVCIKSMTLFVSKNGKFWGCEDKDNCGLRLNDERGKPVKTAPCTCQKGVLVRKKAKAKGKYWWGCSAFNSGCKQRHFDEKGKPGKAMTTAT